MGKSNAQLKRLQKRAEARGEVYESPPVEESEKLVEDQQCQSQPAERDETKTTDASVKLKAAEKLRKRLDEIASDTELKAKERRSEKRKAEALAAEATGVQAQELLDWYGHQQQKQETEMPNVKEKQQKVPYIAFFGQLSFKTTAEGLFSYLQKQLGSEVVTPKTVKIRLLTKQDGKSRGLAFVETSTPELLYSCLSLHRTYLDGRRINVERSAGGSNPGNRQSKLATFRQDQQAHLSRVIEGILKQYNIAQEGGPLDQNVVHLCEKHAPSVVQTALERFVETNGPDKDNPSAYLTFLLTKFGQEDFDLSERSKKIQAEPVAKKRKVSRPHSGKISR